MTLLTGNSNYAVTNWDPATAQKVMAALIAKYPKIDGIIANFGTDALAVDPGASGGKSPARPDGGARCQRALLPVQVDPQVVPNYQIATISNRNWLGRIAARKAIAAAEGLPNGGAEPHHPALLPEPLTSDTAFRSPCSQQHIARRSNASIQHMHNSQIA